MTCRLCLKITEEYFNFFDAKGINLNASEIVGKYFWFQPQKNDFISESICSTCWNVTENFHNLYLQVEESQKMFLNHMKIDPNEIYLDEYQSSDIDIQDICDEIEEEKSDLNTVISLPEPEQDIKIKNETETEVQVQENSTIKIESEFRESVRETRLSTRLKNATTLKLNDTKLNLKNEPSVANRATKKSSSILKISEPISESITDSNIFDGLIKFNTKKPKKKLRENKEKTGEKSLKQITMQKEDEMINKFLKISCPVCFENLENYKKLSPHFTKHHKEKSYIECCGIKFYKRNKLVDHVQKHTNPDHFKCKECGKVLKNRWCYKLHQRNHSNLEILKNYECNICNKKFPNPSSLQRHKVTHMPDSEKHYSCDICGKLYATEGILELHKRNIHENRTGGVCDLCGKQYRQTADLRRHRLQHEGIEPEKVQCHICNQWYTSKYKLNRHLRRHQENNLTFPCPHCNKITPSREALKSHVRYIHKMERKYSCTLCEKAFRQPIELKEHLAWHSGAKLYVCPHCPKTFSHNSNLHHHRKQVHRKEFEEIRALKGKRDINWKSVIEISKAPMGIEIIEEKDTIVLQ